MAETEEIFHIRKEYIKNKEKRSCRASIWEVGLEVNTSERLKKTIQQSVKGYWKVSVFSIHWGEDFQFRGKKISKDGNIKDDKTDTNLGRPYLWRPKNTSSSNGRCSPPTARNCQQSELWEQLLGEWRPLRRNISVNNNQPLEAAPDSGLPTPVQTQSQAPTAIHTEVSSWQPENFKRQTLRYRGSVFS